MHQLLSPLARVVAERPRRVLVAFALLTVVFAGLTSDQRTDTDLTAFAPDSELAAALDRVQEEFTTGGESLQVVIDAGAGGDVLDERGRAAAERVTDALLGADVDLGGAESRLRTFLDDPQLLSIDAGDGSARAGLVMLPFPPTMDEVEVWDASLELARVVDELDVDGVDIDAFNAAVLGNALEDQSMEEMPRLLMLSMVLILGILLFQYRTVSDVAIGLVGLVGTIIWMMGLGVLLGPGYLEVVGPFSQIAMVVPVLLVGLGIDYAIHLTSRYREEQSHGLPPDRSAGMAVRTVGGALVLATITTVVGFLTNLVSPLPPIADFGVFTAVGVLAAFVIMTAVAPAARNVLDQRRARRGAAPSDESAPAATAHRPASGLASVVGRVAVVAERIPRLTLGIALAVSLVAAGAATQVGTTFSQEDFIPEDSEIGDLLDRIEALFGGDIDEVTFVLMDGDLATPEAANAQLAVQDRVAELDDVRSVEGAAQVSSPAGLVAAAAAEPAYTDRIADLGYTPEEGFAPDADVAALYDVAREAEPARAAQTIGAGDASGVVSIATVAGQDGARDLLEQLEPLVQPLTDAGISPVVTSEPLVLEESLDALTDSQTQGIVVTLVAALVLLVLYYGFADRTPVLGVITMIPSIAVVTWVLGTMWLMGISFNVLTAMVASLGIGIGVPFGIHVTHRFLEDRRRYDTVDEAVRMTVTHTGGAMAGSAATTAAGFGVLVFASLTPMQQFGTIVAITIIYSFIAAVVIQPACLKLWGERRARRGDVGELHEHERRDVEVHEPAPVG